MDFSGDPGYVELGTFWDVLHRSKSRHHDLTSSLTFELDKPLTVNDPDTADSLLFEDDKLAFAVSVRGGRDTAEVVRRMQYTYGGHTFSYELLGSGKPYHLSQSGSTSFQIKCAAGRPWELPPPVKYYGFPDQVYSYFRNVGFLADLQLAFEQQLAGLYYLGPLREYPQRYYSWSGGARAKPKKQPAVPAHFRRYHSWARGPAADVGIRGGGAVERSSPPERAVRRCRTRGAGPSGLPRSMSQHGS